MKNTIRLLTFALVLAVLSVPAFAQTTATYNTSLSAALTQGSTTMVVASTTNMVGTTQTVKQNAVIIDGFGAAELVQINSVNTTSKQVTISRGQGGKAVAHVSGALVFFGPAGGAVNGLGDPFTNVSPSVGATCTSTQFLYLPVVNYQDGSVWNCANSQFTSDHYGVNGQTLAYTATLGDYIIAYTTLSATRTVTLPTPVGGMRGKVFIIKNQTTSANTIWVTGGTPDGSTSLALYAAGGLQAGRFYTDGVSWFSW